MKYKKKKIIIVAVVILLVALMVLYLLPPSLYGFPYKSEWNPQAISIFDKSGLYVSTTGDLYEWGTIQYGAPYRKKRLICRHVMEDVQSFALPISGLLVLRENGELWSCYGINSASVFLDEIPDSENIMFMEDVTSIAASDWRCYAVQKDGTLWAWGSWSFGDVAKDKKEIIMGNAAAVACSQEELYAVLTKGQEVYVGGRYYIEETNEVVYLDTPMRIASGISEVSGCCNHGFLLLAADGTIYHYLVGVGLKVVAQDGLHLCGSGFLKEDHTLWYYSSDDDESTHFLAEDVVNANCNSIVVNYVQSDGTITVSNIEGEGQEKFSVLDFAPNRWNLLRFWIFRWI